MTDYKSNTVSSDGQDYVAQLYVLLNQTCSDIQECTIHCAAWRSADQRTGDSLVIGADWPPLHDIYTARESLLYRLSSLSWHLRTIGEVQRAEAQKISQAEIKNDYDPNVSRHALMRIGYLFDDIIFNTVSAFDYLAKYICKIHFPAERRMQLDWRKLRLINARQRLEDRNLSDLIESIDTDWFRHLDRLRGDIIHDGAEVGGMKFKSKISKDGLTHTFDFNVPEKVTRLLPLFKDDAFISIEAGSALIMLNSLLCIRNIIQKMKTFEYVNMHDPFEPDRMRKAVPI